MSRSSPLVWFGLYLIGTPDKKSLRRPSQSALIATASEFRPRPQPYRKVCPPDACVSTSAMLRRGISSISFEMLVQF